MCGFCYNYVKPNYGQNTKLCYMDKSKRYFYKHITEDVETKIWYFKSWIRRPLPKGKNKKVIGLMKDELDGQIIQEFVGLRAKI